MGSTRAMACVFLFVSLFVQSAIEVSSTSSHLTPESQVRSLSLSLMIQKGTQLKDLCGALHCDLVMDSNSKFRKTKCNPAAAARNRHLCESLADSCFPVNQSPSANRLHELFLRQFCDAHTCSGGRKPFSRGGQKHTSILYLAISILVLMFLPIFYVIVYLYQREMKKGTQELKRISQLGRKTKPS